MLVAPSSGMFQLDKEKKNVLFESWKLCSDVMESTPRVSKLGRWQAYSPSAEKSLVSTKAVAKWNGLWVIHGNITIFFTSDADDGRISLVAMDLDYIGTVDVDAEMTKDPEAGAFRSCCVWPIHERDAKQNQMGIEKDDLIFDSAPLPPTIQQIHQTCVPEGQQTILASSGHGDLRLFRIDTHAPFRIEPCSNIIFPFIKDDAVSEGGPFEIVTAFGQGEDAIVAVVWAVYVGNQSTSSEGVRTRSGNSSSKTYVITIGVQGDQDERIVLRDVCAVSDVCPGRFPYGAYCNPEKGACVLIKEAHAGEEVSYLDGEEPLPCDDEIVSSDLSPHTQHAASHRLEEFTSDVLNDPRRGGPVDIYRENEEDMMDEPPVELQYVLYDTDAASWTLRNTNIYGEHKLLQCMDDSQREMLYLLVSDGVDCAQIEIKTVSPLTDVQSDTCMSTGNEYFEFQHATTIPALTYIRNGKRKTKYLLASPGTFSALVESDTYCYVYAACDTSTRFGRQQILALPDGPVFGAQILSEKMLLLLTKNSLLLYTLLDNH